MRSFALAAAVATAAVHLGSALAQEQADREVVLEEITVTASPLGDVLQPTRVLDEEVLFVRKSATLGETLDGELGVSSSYFGPASSRPIIRGLGGSRVQMLSDTIASLDVADVSADHAVTIEPLLAEGIEVIRGPTTLLYGSGAAGGVVNVLDNRIPSIYPDAPLSGAFEVRADTAAAERAFVGRLDGGSGPIAWHLDAFSRETENLDIEGFATADPAQRPEDESAGTLSNSFSESDGFTVGLSWVGQNGYLGVAYADLANTYGLPGPEVEEEEEEEITGPGLEGPFLDMEQTRVDVRGQYAFESGWLESISGAFGTNDYAHAEIEPSGEVATLFANDAWQLRGEAVHRPLAGWRGAFGVQLDDRDFSAEGEEAFIGPTQTQGTGIFLVEEKELSWGHLYVGGRIETVEHDNAEFSNYDEDAFSLAVGLETELTDEYQLLVNLTRAERHPNSEELYSNGAHIATRQFEIGLLVNGEAQTETSFNFELGIQRRSPHLHWSIAAFLNDIADFVYQDLTGASEDGLPVAQYTQQDARFVGVEAEVVVPIQLGAGLSSELRWFGDYVEPELDSGAYLPRIPPFRTGFNLRTGTDAWRAAMDIIYHAAQDNISSFPTGSYTLVNLTGTYRIDREDADWELLARATNLLDEDARKSTSFLAPFAPLPGRSFHLGARMLF